MYASFLENLTATSWEKRRLMITGLSTKTVEQPEKDDIRPFQRIKVPTHTLTTNWVKNEVNSTVSRLYCVEIVESSVLASNLGHNIL